MSSYLAKRVNIATGRPRQARRYGALPVGWAPGLIAGGIAVLLLLYLLFRKKTPAADASAATPGASTARDLLQTLEADVGIDQTQQPQGIAVLTYDEFHTIMPTLPAAQAQAFLPYLNNALAKMGLSRGGACAFLANVAEETGELKYLVEGWLADKVAPNKNGTSQEVMSYWQNTYEGRKDLGNTEVGDGYRYRGRGALQITGRSAYRLAGNYLGLALEDNPDLVETEPEAIFGAAVYVWNAKKLSPYAEARDLLSVSKGINRGNVNSPYLPLGWDVRQRYYQKATSVLGV